MYAIITGKHAISQNRDVGLNFIHGVGILTLYLYTFSSYGFPSLILFCLVLSFQDQWCQPSHTQDSTAASTASDQQWSVCPAAQGLHQHAEAGGPLHCMGVRVSCRLPNQFKSVRECHTQLLLSTFYLQLRSIKSLRTVPVVLT